jgi:hypothetical protein
MAFYRGLTFDMSGVPKSAKRPWNVRSMEWLGAASDVLDIADPVALAPSQATVLVFRIEGR